MLLFICINMNYLVTNYKLNRFILLPILLAIAFFSSLRAVEENLATSFEGKLKESISLKEPLQGQIKSTYFGKVFIPEGSSLKKQLFLKRMAIYDVGSTGVKFLLADVDPMSNSIVRVLYKMTVDTNALFGTIQVTQENAYERYLVMAALKTLVEQYFPHFHPIEHYGVATGGFRASDKDLAGNLVEEIKERLNIDFKIASQDIEGQMAYLGVLAVKDNLPVGFDIKKDIVWDIGGSSSQLIFPNSLNGYSHSSVNIGARIAHKKFFLSVRNINEAEYQAGASPYPLSFEDLESFLSVLETLILSPVSDANPLSREDVDVFKSQIAKEAQVFGVGAVHNFIAKGYVKQLLIKTGEKYEGFYTRDQIEMILQSVLNKKIDEVYREIKGGNLQPSEPNYNKELEYVKGDILVLGFVWKLMTILNIDKVYTVSISNTEGIIMDALLQEKGMSAADVFKRAMNKLRTLTW